MSLNFGAASIPTHYLILVEKCVKIYGITLVKCDYLVIIEKQKKIEKKITKPNQYLY